MGSTVIQLTIHAKYAIKGVVYVQLRVTSHVLDVETQMQFPVFLIILSMVRHFARFNALQDNTKFLL